MARIGSVQDLASKFGGTFIEQDGRGDGSLASSEFTPEVDEEDERVFGRDPLRRFVPLEDMPDDAPLPWTKRNWAKRASFPIGITANRA